MYFEVFPFRFLEEVGIQNKTFAVQLHAFMLKATTHSAS